MSFGERRSGLDARALAGAAALALIFAARSAAATPIDDPFVAGMSFSGPTSGDLGAIYWNPAALGLMRGFQLMVAGTARWSSVTVSRAPINSMTGAGSGPGATTPTGSATATDFRQPFTWPPGPGAYVALGYGSDRFTLAFATYMPYLEKISFPGSPAGNEPTRYQMLSMDLRNLALVPALAIRFGNDFRVGLSSGFLFSTGSLSFDEDTALDGGTAGLQSSCGAGPCGAENPAAAARYNIDSGQGIGDASFSLTLGGGVYYRHKNLELGLSYQSHPLGSQVSNVEVTADQTTVALPARQGGGLVTCAGQSSRCLFGDIAYRLPDVVIGGLTWHFGPGLQLDVMTRWIWTHLHDRIDIRLVGPTLAADGLPEHIVLYRGFHDAVDTRARVAYWYRERLRVGAELRLENGAVDTNAINAAAVDGFQIEPLVLAELRLGRRFWLGAGYGLTIMPGATVANSSFNPADATVCADMYGNLASPACQARANGTARPTANGTYTNFVQDFGLTFTFRL